MEIKRKEGVSGIRIVGHNKKLLYIILALLVLLIIVIFYIINPPKSQLPNPASVYCEEQGYILETRIGEEGGAYGICIFDDGSECNQWDYYYGRCVPGAECSIDNDCVPASCCHASECVPISEKPNCQGIFCTSVCEPGTMDCGQGSCKCLNNKCTAIIE